MTTLESNSGNVFFSSPSSLTDIGSWLLSTTSLTSNPYIVILALDRDEYTAGHGQGVGSFLGGLQQASLTASVGDARQKALVFQYNSATGKYDNASYGSLDAVGFLSANEVGSMTSISAYASATAPDMSSIDADPYNYIYGTGREYLGSSVVITSKDSDLQLGQATPSAVAAAAAEKVGQVVNDNGCWVLASTISAEAGAALPITSVAAGGTALGNGIWQVAYDGTQAADSHWQDELRAGDIVSFVTSSGSGHITTVASGFGKSAKLIDNLKYIGFGSVINSGNDGDPDDVTIVPAHSQDDEFTGVNASTVTVYRLDTPVIESLRTITSAIDTVISLGDLVAAADPFGKSITRYEVYTPAFPLSMSVSGQACVATSSNNAVSLPSLAGVGIARDALSNGQIVMIRACNGTYWGDWTAVALTPSANGGYSAVAQDVYAMPASGQLATGVGENTIVLGGTGGSVLSYGTNTIFGGSQSSTIKTFSNATKIVGGSGLMNVEAGSGRIDIQAGAGGLNFTGGGGFATVIGGGNPMHVTGGTGGGTYFGGGGSTIVAGQGMNDLVIGGNGDKLSAEGSHTVLFGVSGGNVELSSEKNTGTCVFFGSSSSGEMTFITGSGSDLMTLGQGINHVRLGSGRAVIFGNGGTTSHSDVEVGTGSLDMFVSGADTTLSLSYAGPRSVNLWNFGSGKDTISLKGFAEAQIQDAVAGQQNVPQGTTLSLRDGTAINLVGVSHATLDMFTVV